MSNARNTTDLQICCGKMIGFVYALRSDGFIKIGWSRNPEARLRLAKTFNPHPVELVGFYDAEAIEESNLHEKFSEYRRVGTEWFKDAGAVSDWASGLVIGRNDVFKDWIKARRGSQTRIAAFLNTTRPNVHQWRSVPAEYVLKVEEFTGISRYDLRPDVFGAMPVEAAE